MEESTGRLWQRLREHAGHWVAGGIVVALTGLAPEEWLGRAVHELHVPENALHLWAAGIDVRVVPITVGVAVVAIALIDSDARVPAPPHRLGDGREVRGRPDRACIAHCRTGHRSRCCRSPT